MRFVDGRGVRVVDSAGKAYYDLACVDGRASAGHGDRRIAEAAYEQTLKLASAPGDTVAHEALRTALHGLMPGSWEGVVLAESRARAMEAAIGIAAQRSRGSPGEAIVAVQKRTAFASDLARKSGVVFVPQPDPYSCEMGGTTPAECAVRCARAVEKAVVAAGPSAVCALVAEPVSRLGVVPGDEYWPMLREICNEYGIVLIADESTCGLGRSGKVLAGEGVGASPDIVVLGDALAGGYLPLGALLVRIGPAPEENTNGGRANPVSCAAAVKHIEAVGGGGLAANAAEVGPYLKEVIEGLKVDHPAVAAVRGRGLLLGIELADGLKDRGRAIEVADLSARTVRRLSEQGVLVYAEGSALTIAPPLTITREEVDEAVHAIDIALWAVEGELGVAIMA